MTRSMTAYGQAVSPEKEGLSWFVEIHSINRKILDLNLFLPKDFLHLDIEIRKLLRKEISRGLITVKVSLKKTKKGGAELKALKTHWEKIAGSLGFPKDVVTFSFLATQVDNLSFQELGLNQKTLEATLTQTIEKALKNLIAMREKEGKALGADINKRLQAIEESVLMIEKKRSQASEKYRKKLQERIEEVVGSTIEDDRILREVAIFAEKIDITEEIIRLKSHLSQAAEFFQKKTESIGRSLEFLIQEILREVNTIGSKTADLSVTKLIVAAKAEIEKIREQLQNIE